MCKLSVAVFLLCVGYISAGDLLHGHHSIAAAPALGLGGYSAHYAAAPAAVYHSGYGYGAGHGIAAAAAPAYGASYVASAPALGYAHAAPALGYAHAAPALGYAHHAPALGYAHATAKHVQYGHPSVQNVFAERAHVIPGQEYVYKVQAPPKIKKEVVQVAQVVHQPKVLYSEVVAPAKVDRETVLVDQKPHIVSVQPNIHKEQVVFVQPKAVERIFVAQKRRDTVAKRVEYERHNFKTVHLNPHPEVKVVGVNQYEKAPSVAVHGPGPIAVAHPGHAAGLFPTAGVSAVKVEHAPGAVLSHAHYGHHFPAAAGFAHYPAGAGFISSAGALLPSAGALFPSTASFLPSVGGGATITKVEHKPASVTVVNEGSASLPSISSSSSLLSGTKN